MWELDHLFILTDPEGRAGDRLVAADLTPGSGQAHPGQGTCNRRFFFHNAMLELLWVNNPQEAQGAVTRPTYLWERWQGREHQACPLGLGLRPQAGWEPRAPEFPHWDYRPAYWPGPPPIYMGANADCLTEPLVFAIPFGQRPDQGTTQPLQHPLGWRELTAVRLVGPTLATPSATLAAVAAIAALDLQAGEAHHLELHFDGATTGQSFDGRPEMPLVCRW